MSRHPLLTPRWLLAHVLVALAAVAFVLLGSWQLDRWGEERRLAAQIDERLAGPPVPLDELDGRPTPEIEHRPVEVAGRYLTDEEVLLRSRSHEGRSGYHVVTPLELGDGRAVLVNRGWVPFELDEPPVAEARPPVSVTVTGIVVASTPRPSGFGPTDPAQGELERLFHADVERIGRQVDTPLLPFLVQLTAQQPSQSVELPVPADLPAADPTQNLSYAGQWFSFAAIAVVGYGLGMRHLVRQRRGGTDRDPTGATAAV